MPRSPLFAVVRRALRLALASPAECADQDSPRTARRDTARAASDTRALAAQLTRRGFARGAAASLGGVALGQLGCRGAAAPPAAPRRSAPSIAIVGAGLAGLVCAHRLRQAGVACAIFEASGRVGGRTWTARGRLADAQLAELGGELIDSNHHTLRGLAAELGLALDDLTPAPGVLPDTFHFGGRSLAASELAEMFRPLARRMQRDVQAARRDPAELARLDALSVAEYLADEPELDATLAGLLDVAYCGEYGRELGEQSAFNLLWLIDSAQPSPFRIFGDSDERFHVHLGSDQIAARLSAPLEPALRLGERLTRISQRGARYVLSFDGQAGPREHTAEALVLALPFSMLRQVELALPLPPARRRMIDELGIGTNAKLFGQFGSRIWLERHLRSGSSYSDLGPQTTWDASRGQPGSAGLLTILLGGRAGLDAGSGTPEAQLERLTPAIERIFPGAQAAYRSGSALRMHWPSAPFCRGSYTCYRPGQAAWAGQIGARLGHLHFCGEHTSVSFLGYMEGAAESGERAARELLADLGIASRPRERLARLA